MELYISDHPLDCLDLPRQRHCELQDMAGRSACAKFATATKARIICMTRRTNRIRISRSIRRMHRVLSLRARVRGNARHVRADDRRAWLRIESGRERKPAVHGIRMRVVRRVRAGVPDRDADGKIADRKWSGRPRASITTCAYCGVGCSFNAEMKGERSRAHGAEQERPRQPRSRVRERPLCVGLRDASGPHHQADDPREDHRSVARSELGRSASLTPRRSSAASRPSTAAIRSAALLRRDARTRKRISCRNSCARLRQQQCRYLRARLPFADRLWPEEHARRIGRHADFRFGRARPTSSWSSARIRPTAIRCSHRR